MITGVKAIDKLIATYGIHTSEAQNSFQRVYEVYGSDTRIANWKLPWCIYTQIMAKPETQKLFLHTFYLPYRKARLACFLVDEKGTVLEQVDYLRERKMVVASQKLRKQIVTHYHGISEAA